MKPWLIYPVFEEGGDSWDCLGWIRMQPSLRRNTGAHFQSDSKRTRRRVESILKFSNHHSISLFFSDLYYLRKSLLVICLLFALFKREVVEEIEMRPYKGSRIFRRMVYPIIS